MCIRDSSAPELLEYLRSWSGYNNYRQQNPNAEDPMLELQQYCTANFKEKKIRVVWPLRLLVSVKSGD